MLLALVGCSDAAAVTTEAPAATATQAVARATLPPVASVNPTATPNPTATAPVEVGVAAEPTLSPASTALPRATVGPPTATSVVPTPAPATPLPPPATYQYSLPMGLPDRLLGDGLYMRHGYGVENTWFFPGHWHAGEDWYLIGGDAGGLPVYAIAAGEVVYVGADYPGLVIIIQHPDGLFSMYGHLDPVVAVGVGQRVGRSALLGTILRRSDSVPNHLHFEVRTFYTTPEVNGATPRYGYACGVNCPPGPGYWPIGAPEHPSVMGWRNPTHVIINRALAPTDGPVLSEVAVSSQPVVEQLDVWSAPPAPGAEREVLGTLPLEPGARFVLLERWTEREDTQATSSLGYQVWFKVQLPEPLAGTAVSEGWVAAVTASTNDTGSDGRPSSVFFHLLPVVTE